MAQARRERDQFEVPVQHPKLWVRREAMRTTPEVERLADVALAGDQMPAGVAVYRRMRNIELLGRKAPRKQEVIAK
jgi:hypothetical protein